MSLSTLRVLQTDGVLRAVDYLEEFLKGNRRFRLSQIDDVPRADAFWNIFKGFVIPVCNSEYKPEKEVLNPLYKNRLGIDISNIQYLVLSWKKCVRNFICSSITYRWRSTMSRFFVNIFKSQSKRTFLDFNEYFWILLWFLKHQKLN